MAKILIVEDDEEIAMLERDYLEIEGFQAQVISDGGAAEEAALTGAYDLILLDLMLPGRSGYEVCRRIRDQVDVPILMVTARTESVDKIRGLGLGADDYIGKPFDPAELVARVKSHLSRYQRLTGGRGEDDGAIQVGDLRILPQSWKVFKGEQEIKMPNREFALLKFLAENPNIVFSKERLFETIWGYAKSACLRPSGAMTMWETAPLSPSMWGESGTRSRTTPPTPKSLRRCGGRATG